MNTLAFIPARGGSKRLPRKNAMLFCGEPLLAYTIKQAQSCNTVNKVVVSTDDEEIAKIAREYNAEVIIRPAEISDDHASTASAVKHGLLVLQEQGYHADAVVTLQVTAPLRPVKDIDNAVELFYKTSNCDSVIGVTKNKHKLGVLTNGYYSATNYSTGSRSQDLQDQYFENGLVYVTQPKLVLEQDDLFGKKIVPYIVNEFYAEIDIDEQADFELAEILYKHYKNLFDINE